MKCKHCNGTGEIINDALRWTSCPVCGGKGETAQTNEEWLHSLSTKEKAKMLGRVSFCDFCPHQLSEHCAWTTGYSEDCVYGNKENEELWLNWLNEEHND